MSALKRLTKADGEPSLEKVNEIARACNVSLDWLAYGKEVGSGFPEPETIHKALWSVLTPLIDHNLITVHDKVEREKLSRYLAKHLEEYHEAELAKRKSPTPQPTSAAQEVQPEPEYQEPQSQPAESPVMQSGEEPKKEYRGDRPKSKVPKDAEEILHHPAIEVPEGSIMAESVSIEEESAAGNRKPEKKKRKSLAARMEIPKGYTAQPAANDLEPLPIYGVAAGSTANSLTISQEAMDHTERPEALQDETNAYALFVNGSSMAPLFRSGDTVYVCPDREYSEGDYVIVKTQLYSSAPVMSYIKHFVGKTGDGIALKQLNPPADMEFKDRIVTAIHRVVLAEELAGKKGS